LIGLNAENLEAVSICLERRGVQVVVQDADGSLGLVGGDDILARTSRKPANSPASSRQVASHRHFHLVPKTRTTG
jgi:hypothetical protein